ncbi:MAG: response regulator transcription factor [Flavobacteriales bacterium]|jgi:two-component system LytT family response regulator|nr:response regulator transcription factor [Flavobacteriales bacterium]MBK7943445.1 response regulator transcription factor [Flavobacteriales bacterium]MBK9699866.1 response regulator transcription factor [Flavobacteriales bacterium]
MSTQTSIVRAIIVDDDAYSRSAIRKQLERFTDAVAVLDECASGAEGVRSITAHAPDLVFLDIQMKGMDGFAMLDALPRRDFGVIFTTSHDEYAIRAIRYSALDYLLKPIKPSEFDAALGHFIANRAVLPARVERLVSTTKEAGAPRTLVIPMRDGDRHINVADIIRCEADRNYTVFHMARGVRVVSSRTLNSYEEFLAENDFLRVHRSHIVNRMHVQEVTAMDEALMSDGSRVEISRRRKTEILEALGRRAF